MKTGYAIPYLADWRRHKGWSQATLSKLCTFTDAMGKQKRVSAATIARIEQGGEANDITVSRIAKGLGITREQLLTGPQAEARG